MGCALPFSSGEYNISCGTIVQGDGELFLVRLPDGMLRATRAAGCLLMPEAGDMVLVAEPQTGTVWVLSVLQRRDDGEARMKLPAQTAVCAEDLRLDSRHMQLRGQEDLQLNGQHVRLRGQEVDISGTDVAIQGTTVSVSGGILTQSFGNVCLFARNLLGKFGIVSTECRKKCDTVHETSELTAGRMRVAVKDSVRVRAEQMDMVADKHMVLDAEHIKVG